jgi:K+-transporting ATPase A subunit
VYEIGQIIVNLALVALGIHLFTKKTEKKIAEGETLVTHRYRIVGIIIIILVVLGALSPYMPKS